MLYSVEQVSIQLNVSKQTIYNKLKLKEYKDKIVIKQGKSMIDDDLFNLIKDNLKVKSNLNNDTNIGDSEEPQEPIGEDEPAQDTILLNINKDLIMTLIEQLHHKDIQIQAKDLQIHELHKLIENSQVLLRDTPQDIKQLEEHFQDLDNTLIDIKATMQTRKLQQKQKHQNGFFYNIFRK